jgi:site-specific recombinase XerD
MPSRTGYKLPLAKRGPRPPRPRPIPFTRDEIRRIFNYRKDANNPWLLRSRALYSVLYRGALRIGATLRMKPTDIDWQHRTIRIYKDKGGKTRSVPLDVKTFELLYTWATTRTGFGIGDDAPFFCAYRNGSRGNPLSYASVRLQFIKLLRAAGIDRYVSLHLFRHTGASELLEEGFDVCTISRLLGHADLLTTYRYLHELRPDLMNLRVAQREW